MTVAVNRSSDKGENMNTLIIISLVALLGFGSSDCFQCYNCIAEEGKDCKSTEDMTTEECDPGINLCLTLDRKGVTTLSCATETNKEAGCKGNKETQQCYCQGDLCNAGAILHPSIPAFLSITLMLLLR